MAYGLLAAVVLIFYNVSLSYGAESGATQPTVSFSAGTVIGTTTQYPGAKATNNQFLGIPYAQSPPLRFGLPVAALPFNEPLVATSHKPGCLQQSTTPGSTPNGQSEDCLYANVFTPSGSMAGSNKTVMVWIYGGNLQTGDSSIPMFDGSSFAGNQDVIVVTFNYRISAFGFSNAPEIPVSQQNVGFYDQRLALLWVQNNIYEFGGDPSKVTIFGQSAGGYSVKYLLALPPSPVPYRAAIMESQATLILGNGTQSWNSLAEELGCFGPSTLACVRAANASVVQTTVANQNLGFPPVEDEITFVGDTTSSFSTGTAAKVPILLGTNGQEASAIPFLLGLNGAPLIDVAEALAVFLPVIGDIIVNVLKDVLQDNIVFNLATTVFTDIAFQCDTARLTELLQGHGYSTWRYYYNASFPNTEIFAGSGAYHGAELPEVFGTFPQINATTQEIALSVYMQSAWANFSKNPPAGPGWPEYGSDESVGLLGSNGNNGEETISAADIDGVCNTLSVLGTLTSLLPSANASSPLANVFQKVLQLDF